MRLLKVVVYTLLFLIIFWIADLLSVFYPIALGNVYISGIPYQGTGEIIYRYPVDALLNGKLIYKTPELSVGLIATRVLKTTSVSDIKKHSINVDGVVQGQTATQLIESAHSLGLKVAVGVSYYVGFEEHRVMFGDNIFKPCTTTVFLDTNSFMSSYCFPKGYKFVDKNIKLPSNSIIRFLAISGSYNSIKAFLTQNKLNLVALSYWSGLFFYENMLLLLVLFVVLFAIVGTSIISMINVGLRMDIVKKARKLFVFYSVGTSLWQLSLGILLVELLQIVSAGVLAFLIDIFFDKVRYFPTQKGLRFVLGLSGKEVYYYLSRSLPWRIILYGAVLIFILSLILYWTRRNLREVFYRRGITSIPSRAIIVLSFLVTIIMVILAAWGITVYDRLSLIRKVYAPKGYIVQDNDLEVSVLQGYNTVKIVKNRSVPLARIMYIVSENTIYTCYTPDMEHFIAEQLPYIKKLWAGENVLVKNSCKPFKDSILTADGVLDITYIPSSFKEQFIDVYVDISVQRRQELIKLNPSAKDIPMNPKLLKDTVSYIFYSAERRIRFSLSRAYFMASTFIMVSIFSFLYFMFSIAEIMLKLTPFRLSIYIISGYTLRQAMREIVMRLIKWIIFASVSATIVGYIISKLLWNKLGWDYPSSILVLAASVFVPLVSYMGIELGGLRLQKEGVIKILKADL